MVLDHFVNWPFRQMDIWSIILTLPNISINLIFSVVVITTSCFINLSFHRFAVLSTCHFPQICYFISWTCCFVKLSLCHLLFCQYACSVNVHSLSCFLVNLLFHYLNLVTVIFSQSWTIRSISNWIDMNSDQIPNFLAWLTIHFLPEIFVQRLDK